MPQMSPLWWEMLFILFISSFMIMNMIIFYNKILSPTKYSEGSNPKINQFKWKW
uniref:ATPase subunit 8 n=1 Tax=Manocoreus sp. TaxID=2931905 RepID=A0A8T9VZZ8_9HEMI|nr:ATPase subunit 8 [Manocoreus sp.]